MKRKQESDDELNETIDVENSDEFRDHLLESDEFVQVIKSRVKQCKLALPQHWVAMYHKSGGIIYLNRKTRVCTWARPYHIGGASVRRHDVPTLAIPCLHQSLMVLRKEHQSKMSNLEDISSDHGDAQSHDINAAYHSAVIQGETILSDDKVEAGSTSNEVDKLALSSAQDITTYLSRLWEFRDATKEQVGKFLFSDKMTEGKDVTLQDKHSESLLKTIPYLIQGKNPRAKNQQKFVINPAGKSSQSLLYEYCLKMLQINPEYSMKESGSSRTPFLATVIIDGLQYGSGKAASKKQARQVAAQKTLEIFMPESYSRLVDYEENLKVFDDISIEDPNVYELTTKLGLLSPYQPLIECTKRNQGLLNAEMKFELYQGDDKKLNYSMQFGRHIATGICNNKKHGREYAAQTILQKLHPHLKYWGSVLRIYFDEHKTEELSLKTDTTSSVTSSIVDNELLSDLKREMWKIYEKKDQKAPTKGFVNNIDI